MAIIDSGNIAAIDTRHNLIDHLVQSGFQRSNQVKLATPEDAFIQLTGKAFRE